LINDWLEIGSQDKRTALYWQSSTSLPELPYIRSGLHKNIKEQFRG
jgi:hypothetical protein